MEPPHISEQREDLETRLEILEALLLACSRRTEVLEVVGAAEGFADAVGAVRDLLGVGDIPARAVLDLQISRFTSKRRAELTSMRDEARQQLEELQ